MATKAKEKEPEVQPEAPQSNESKAVTTTQGAGALAISDDLMKYASAGDDFASNDISIPFVRILQKLSPEVDEESSDYLEGAKPGMLLNTATGKLYDAKEGIVIIPVRYQRELTEWKPRESGGGMVAYYGTDLSPLARAKKNEKGKPVTTDGNNLVESGTYYCLLFNPADGSYEQVIIGMSSSNFKPARAWNTMIKNLRVSDGKGGFVKNPSLFLGAYKLSSEKVTKDVNTWYIWKTEFFGLTPNLPNGADLVREAFAFREAIEAGRVKPQEAGHDSDAGSDDIPF